MIVAAAFGLGMSLAIIYERLTPPGGMSWQTWAIVAAIQFGVLIYALNYR